MDKEINQSILDATKDQLYEMRHKIQEIINESESRRSSFIPLLTTLDAVLKSNKAHFDSREDDQEKKEALESYQQMVVQFAAPVLISLREILGERKSTSRFKTLTPDEMELLTNADNLIDTIKKILDNHHKEIQDE